MRFLATILLPTSHAPSDDASPLRSITSRSVLFGLLTVIWIGCWNTYCEYIAHTARMNISHFPMALLCTYVLIVFGNQALRQLSPSTALGRNELLVVLSMGLVGAAVPAYGLTSFFLGMISVPYYRATPENQWAEIVHPHLPTWLTPSNEGGAMRWLFEGLPQGHGVPWDVWVVPLFWWLALIAAITVGSVAIATILRKQWSENERVAYPMLGPPVSLADAADAPARSGLFWTRLFWVGFALVFTIKAWNIISYFVPGFPRIWLGRQWFYFARYFPPQHTGVNFFTIGFAYFANIDLLFSVVVFHLLYMNEIALSRRIGLAITAKTGPDDPVASLQSAGAFIALVFWTFWTARQHLADVWRKAFQRDNRIDDSSELMSYRTAVIAFIVSVVFIALWIRSTGLDWKMVIPMTVGLFIAYIGLGRVIAETGVVYMSMPINEAGIADLFFHPTDYSAGARTSITLFSAIRTQSKAMFMVPLIHAAKLGDLIKDSPRRLLGAIVLTLVVGVGANILYTLHLSYAYGAFNFSDHAFTRYPPRVYDALVNQIKDVPVMKPERYALMGAGVLIFSAMSALRYRFTWWPINPMGMIVPVGHAKHSTMSIFLAWAAKSIILRIGGIQLYSRCRPFFVGILAGYAMAVFLSFVVDSIWFPGAGHHMHSW
jgi:hypothetical protein